MTRDDSIVPATAAAWSLVLLRTLIGWHFLYEGYYKLALPAWSRGGAPMEAWTASGYLAASTGPLGGTFRALGASAVGPWIDLVVPVGLMLVGISLMLGAFTRAGGMGALAFLVLFYLSAPPLEGLPGPGAEGAYLLVNKNLIEASAVLVLLAFDTGRIAGLDLLRRSRRPLREPTVTS